MEYKIILASKSPRRSQLLSALGFEFEIRTNPIDEVYPDTLSVDEVAAYLAKLKAQAVTSFLEEKNQIILTSDTTVVMGNTIFGKPKDYDDAVHILRQLSGKMHRVVTGVCLKSLDKEVVFSEDSKVYFKELTDEEIEFYIKKYEPYDKAGAYAIQEWIGMAKIKRIEGTYANIMGLPTEKVYDELINW